MRNRRIIRLALPEGDAPPAEFRLFTAGKVRTEKGVFLFDEEAQKLVMEGIERRKTELMLDYNHASLDPKPLDPALAAKASGWHEVELRNGELWAVNIRWTDAAAAGIRAKEWRYYSPAFLDDPKTGRITDYINCALTNLPATHDLTPLVAASQEITMEDDKTKDETEAKLAKALEESKAKDEKIAKLKEENKAMKTKLAEAEKASKETEELEDDEKKEEAKKASRLIAAARKITGRNDLAEVEGALLALSQSHDRIQQLSTQVAELQAQRTNDEVTSLVDQAVREGKVTPAKRDEFIQLGRDNRKVLETTLSMLVPMVATQPLAAPKVDASTVVLSREDEEVIARNGIDREKFIAARKRQLERGLTQ